MGRRSENAMDSEEAWEVETSLSNGQGRQELQRKQGDDNGRETKQRARTEENQHMIRHRRIEE